MVLDPIEHRQATYLDVSHVARHLLELAMLFHQTYERLAPSKPATRTRKRIFDPESPNGKLMVAVCTEILPHITVDRIEVLEEALAKNVELTVQDSATILRAQAAAVPREPTDAMLDAGVSARHVDGSSVERDIWQAMYDAAPESQAEHPTTPAQ